MPQLAIIIPCFRYCCTRLVADLKAQCDAMGTHFSYSITVIDDGSGKNKANAKNERINQWENCIFLKQNSNTGKSKLLNQAISGAKAPFVLLIDCDAEVCDPAFISRYWEKSQQADVICGSIQTSPRFRHASNQLRYRYERNAYNIRKATYRQQHPYAHFTTFNVLLNKKKTANIRFDETISQYGYEDTLFGIQLKQNNISILHIENPLIHTGIDSNDCFLHKTETALKNLYYLAPEIQAEIQISRLANKLQKLHIESLVKIWHKLFSPIERQILLSKNPNLIIFNLYKLGYYLTLPQTDVTSSTQQ